MALKPIKKKRLFEEIIFAIEQYILEEKIQPGEKLPSENELSSIFNVSKTAVREAMSVLHANGIIETRPGSGIYLKDIHGDSIILRVTSNLMEKRELSEVLEFRRGLEVEAAGLAAVKGSKKDLLKIKECNENLLKAVQNGLTGLDEDYLFHHSIILASQNSIYTDVYQAVAAKVKEGMRISKMHSMKEPNRFLQAYDEHKAIVDAILQKDPETAAREMRQHLLGNERKIWEIFESNKKS
ncbi:FadR/GntR family transcriptional regulator [Ammoniphilus sp. 3BR4]|uniref:FadR/GntR family transcriptional regulator n=1 Tax=Ammoniphilus sp. 3BR4 TaxID=3158265 RepID=UPI0034667443